MPGNNRIHYACLALAYCNQSPIDGIKSMGLSFSRDVSTVLPRSSTNPSSVYGGLAEIELKYSSHIISSGFLGFQNEKGLNDFVSFDVLIGSDTSSLLNTVTQSMRLSYMLLSNVTYNLNVDGTFSADRTFKGWNKTLDCQSTLGKSIQSSGTVLQRSAFSLSNSSLPSLISGAPIQSIEISMNINRSTVGEFATHKPYASYINFPIETTCKFETILTNNFDSYNFNMLDTACKNASLYKENLKIATCGNVNNVPIIIDNAYLTSFDYAGADAQSGGSNLKLSLTYTGYQSPSGVSPIIYIDDQDILTPCGC